MRAQIACTRCRRSKIKCTNHGNGTACQNCVTNKHTCEYKDAQSTTTANGSYPLRESTAGEIDVSILTVPCDFVLRLVLFEVRLHTHQSSLPIALFMLAIVK
jgi:hypothetical protein